MSAWTVLGLLKLFLEIVDEGPKAIVKGILISSVPTPYGEIIDVGEILFGLFGLDENYQGTVTLRGDQYVPLNRIQLLNKDRLDTALAQYDFPQLAQREFAVLEKRGFQKRSFPRFFGGKE